MMPETKSAGPTTRPSASRRIIQNIISFLISFNSLVPKLLFGNAFLETLFRTWPQDQNEVSGNTFPNGVWERDSASPRHGVKSVRGDSIPGRYRRRANVRFHVAVTHADNSLRPGGDVVLVSHHNDRFAGFIQSQ